MVAVIETYTLSRPEMERLHDLLLRRGEIEGADESEGTLDMLELMLSSAVSMAITYEGPREQEDEEDTDDLCGNCAKPLDEGAYSAYACSELCEEAILERKHEQEVASGEYFGPEAD